MTQRLRPWRLAATASTTVLAVLAVLTGCGLQPATSFAPDVAPGSITPLDLPAGATITITSKNFTEQLILGKIAVLAAKAAGFTVNDMTNVPGSVPARELRVENRQSLIYNPVGLSCAGRTVEDLIERNSGDRNKSCSGDRRRDNDDRRDIADELFQHLHHTVDVVKRQLQQVGERGTLQLFW